MERRQPHDTVRDTGEQSDKVTETLERLDVADNLEELRHQIDDLIERLSEKERETRTGARSGRGRAPEVSTELEEQIGALGSKVERASDLLAELTDVLEAQNERIETIEQQLGDPDVALAEEQATELQASARPATSELPRFSMTERPAPVSELPRYLDQRLDRIEAGIHELERLVVSMANLASSRDRQVRDLEERLLILVDTACDVPQRQPERIAEPRPATRLREVPPASPPATRRTVERRPRGTIGAAEVANLERLVEREVHALRDFRPEVTASVRSRKSRPTVLVVDDAPDALTVLSIYLSKTGFQVVTASSAEDALAKLVHHDVDAIVLDAKMPGADGGHVCRVIAEDDQYGDKRRVPVILYTAYPDEFPTSVTREWQLAEYVVKGGDMLPLITALVRHTNNMEEVR